MRPRHDPARPRPSEITSPEIYHDRRRVLRALLAAGAVGLGPSLAGEADASGAPLKYRKNPALSLDEKPNSLEDITTYNNFYEFGTEKSDPARRSGQFKPRPWTVRVSGEAARTGTFEIEAASGVYNELQAGSYIFMDADYARNKRADGGPYDTFAHALFVYATVMSMTQADRAVIDAGLKSFTFESGPPEPVGFAGAVYERPSDEHGNLNLAQSNARPGLGDKVRLIPGHCDPTVNLHDWYVGIRGMEGPAPIVESVWPVAARGAVF